MKINKLFLGLATIAAAVFSFSSCSSEDFESTNAPQKANQIRLTTNVALTRSVSQTLQESQIASGIHVGAFVTTTGSTTAFLDNATNNDLTADGDGNLNVGTDNEMYFPKNGNVNIYAYAPYNSNWNTLGEQTFTIQTNQSEESAYCNSDLIWATPLTNQVSQEGALALAFNHKLSKINVTITNNRTGLSLNGATVSILNTKPSVSINLSTGNLGSASGTATEITAATLGENETTASAIIVPQEVAAGKFIKIVTNGENNNNESITLYAKLDATKTLAENHKYNYTVTINDNSVELKLGSTTIGNWTEADETAEAEEETPAVTYAVGDYLLNDGTLLKNGNLASADTETKGKIVAVIFSTNSSDDGYDGYAVSIAGKLETNNLAWSTSAGTLGTLKPNVSDAIIDYSGLSSKTIASSNYTTYPVFQCSGAPSVSSSNLSEWFIPSLGQFIDIIQNLGGQSDIRTTITSVDAGSNNNISISTAIQTFLPKINSYADAINSGNVIITASGDGSSDGNCFQYVTSTEKDDSNMWMIKFPAYNATNQVIYLSRGASKTGTSNRNVLPIIAYKKITD